MTILRRRIAQAFALTFALDARSLALLRVGIGLLILFDVATSWPDIDAFYADDGILTREDARSYYGLGETFRLPPWSQLTSPLPAPDEKGVVRLDTGQGLAWSPFDWDGSAAWARTLFSIKAGAAILIILGLGWRIPLLVGWILVLGSQFRQPLILNNGDVLLRFLMLWGLFLPLSRVASLDAVIGRVLRRARKKTPSPASRPTIGVVSIASTVLVGQVTWMYVQAGYTKANVTWLGGSALKFILRDAIFGRPGAETLRGWTEAERFLTLATVVGEFAVGVAILWPLLVLLAVGILEATGASIRPRTLRRARVGLVVTRLGILGLCLALHLGIEVAINVGAFSLTAAVAWLALIPAEFWRRMTVRPRWLGLPARRRHEPRPVDRSDMTSPTVPDESPLSATSAHHGTTEGSGLRPAHRHQGVGTRLLAGTAQSLCLLLALMTATYNASYFGMNNLWDTQRLIKAQFRPVMLTAGLVQAWGMFATPITRTNWVELVGTLEDGRQVNLLQPDPETPWEQSHDPARLYPSHRWRKYLRELNFPEHERFRARLIDYVRQKWEDTYPDHPLEQVELAFITQDILADGTLAPPRWTTIASWRRDVFGLF